MTNPVREYLAEIGRRGGRKSRRTLDPETARDMVRVREARRAYRRFRTSCFWCYRPDLEITLDDVDWVAETLMRNGDREAWLVGRRLCRSPIEVESEVERRAQNRRRQTGRASETTPQ